MTSPLISGRLVDRMSPGLLCVVGLVLLAIGLGAIAIFQTTPPGDGPQVGLFTGADFALPARCWAPSGCRPRGARG